MAKYRPRFVTQFDGTRLDEENCVATAGTIALDRHTLGKIRTNPATMRRHAEAAVGHEIKDGLSQSDLAKAWDRGWNEKLVDPEWEPFSKFADRIAEGRGGVIFGDCQRVRGHINCPGGLSRNHALYINEVDDQERFLFYDPAERNASQGVDWIRADVLRNYADNWTDKVGYVNASYTRVTEDVSETDRTTRLELPAGCTSQIVTFSLIGITIAALVERGM